MRNFDVFRGLKQTSLGLKDIVGGFHANKRLLGSVSLFLFFM